MRNTLIWGDFKDLGDATDQTPREFAIAFLTRMLGESGEDAPNLHELGDLELEVLAQSWLDNCDDCPIGTASPGPALERLRRVYSTAYGDALESMLSLSDSMLANVAPVISSLSSVAPVLQEAAALRNAALDSFVANLRTSTESVMRAFEEIGAAQRAQMESLAAKLQEAARATIVPFEDAVRALQQDRQWLPTGLFFDGLPDLVKRWAELNAAIASLQAEDGYYLLDYLTPADLEAFVGIEKVDPRVRPAVATNQLLRVISNPQFISDFHEVVAESRSLRKRWPVLEQALSSHMARQYAVSIPTLIAQMEGMLTNALKRRKILFEENGKLYALDGAGNKVMNNSGDPIELHSLKNTLKHANLSAEPVLAELADFLTQHIVPDRNDIIHGKKLDYGKARLSAQLLLYIFVLACEIVWFEERNTP